MSRIAVIYLGRRGGGPVYAYEMARGLIENGHHISLFISQYVENIGSWKALKADSIEVVKTYTSLRSYFINTILFRMKEYGLLKEKYSSVAFDACYIPMGHPWDSMFVNICGGPQLITTIHDPILHSSDRTVREYMSRIVSRTMVVGIRKKTPDDVVILSNVFKEIVAKNYKLSPEHIHVIPHGIFDFYKTVDSGKIHNYPKGKTNYLFLGRICGYKGLDILAEAYRSLRQSFDDITLTIVGSGDFSKYRPLYAGQMDVTIINEWIPDDEIASYLKSKEEVILVLPYKDGTQSGVISTAMSFGVPIVATDVGGLREQIQNDVTGYLCAPGDPEALAECMEKAKLNDNSEIIENGMEFIRALDWNTLSKMVGSIVDHENTCI